MKMNKNKIYRISTLNCRGLNNDLKLWQLATDMEDYKLDIMCIQETRFLENKMFEITSLI